MDAFHIEQSDGAQPGTKIVKLTGPLVIAALPTLQPALRALGAETTILDLSQVPHCDSAGLGAILNYLSAEQKLGHRVAVAGAQKRVQMLFDLTKVSTVLPIFATVAEAEQG